MVLPGSLPLGPCLPFFWPLWTVTSGDSLCTGPVTALMCSRTPVPTAPPWCPPWCSPGRLLPSQRLLGCLCSEIPSMSQSQHMPHCAQTFLSCNSSSLVISSLSCQFQSPRPLSWNPPQLPKHLLHQRAAAVFLPFSPRPRPRGPQLSSSILTTLPRLHPIPPIKPLAVLCISVLHVPLWS